MNVIIVTALIFFPSFAQSQGLFLYSNFSAPTRIGSIDGPLAGAGILGQMVAGTNTESLMPVGMPNEHRLGRISDGIVAVPSIAPATRAFIQMVAWDGARWGTVFAAVPPDQLGRSDIVPLFVTYEFQPQFAPLFSQPAIVPVPEPSILALGAIGAALWLLSHLRKDRRTAARSIWPATGSSI